MSNQFEVDNGRRNVVKALGGLAAGTLLPAPWVHAAPNTIKTHAASAAHAPRRRGPYRIDRSLEQLGVDVATFAPQRLR